MSPWPLALAVTVPFQEPRDELLAEIVGRSVCWPAQGTCSFSPDKGPGGRGMGDPVGKGVGC